MGDTTEILAVVGPGALPDAPGAGGGAARRRYRRRMTSSRHVRAALADTLYRLETGAITPGVARAAVYTLAVLLAAFRDEREAGIVAALAARLDALERRPGLGGPL